MPWQLLPDYQIRFCVVVFTAGGRQEGEEKAGELESSISAINM